MKLRYYIMMFFVGILMLVGVNLAHATERGNWTEVYRDADDLGIEIYSSYTIADEFYSHSRQTRNGAIVTAVCYVHYDGRKRSAMMFSVLNVDNPDNPKHIQNVTHISELLSDGKNRWKRPIVSAKLTSSKSGVTFNSSYRYSHVVDNPDGSESVMLSANDLLVEFSMMKEFGFVFESTNNTHEVYFKNLNGIRETNAWKKCVD